MLVDYVGVACESVGHFGKVELFGIVGEACVGFFGHHAIVLPHIRHIECASTFGKVDFAVHADIFHNLVAVAMVDNKRLAKVDFLASFAENFVFKESVGGVAPASAALVLVFNLGGLDDLGVGEFESGAVWGYDFGVTGVGV